MYFKDFDLLLSFVGCSFGLGFGVLNSGLYLGIIGYGCGLFFCLFCSHYKIKRPTSLMLVKDSYSKQYVEDQICCRQGNMHDAGIMQ